MRKGNNAKISNIRPNHQTAYAGFIFPKLHRIFLGMDGSVDLEAGVK